MKEVFLSNHLQREANKSLAICLVSAAVVLALLVAGIAMTSVLVIWASMVALAISGFIVTNHGRTYMTYRCGMQGERILRDRLRSLALGDEHTAYYNPPTTGNGKTSDIDCVLVGPLGLFVLEAKHHRGLIFQRNSIWTQIKAGRRGTPYAGHLGDPAAQLSRNIRRLKTSLRQAGLDAIWIHGAIVFTNARAVLDIEGLRWLKAVAVKDLHQVFTGKAFLPLDQVDRINACLSASAK
ncbi:MAG: Nuclease-related domain protein [Syntrophorhabdaceae bacterium PtaU1.Bin034]|nr:MAG: Nuclease-related domain protein [Syntrophorhabdus sp. PtaB.Bin184]OPY68046.1 MAG: Nuclease-related domain protein [Syntrophorhabdaceae bacterium PtaU1.Bin034]